MSRTAREILIRPLMTEKSMRQKEEQNTVAFRVRPDANKVEIRVAVETVFNVKAIRTVKPTSPSLRYLTYVTYDDITKTEPEKGLLIPKRRTNGRNVYGR